MSSESYYRITSMNIQREKLWFYIVATSLLLHIFIVGSLTLVKIDKKRSYVVKVGIVDVSKTVTTKLDQPKMSNAPSNKNLTSARKPKEVMVPAKSTKSSVDLDKAGLAVKKKTKTSAPLANALMTENSGERSVGTEDLPNDLSADAVLIQDSIAPPEYTDHALDANLVGLVDVDVLVDKEGNVVEVELAKKIGHGMDRRILKAARGAQFVPPKDRSGRPTEGWTSIRFNLRIP